MMHHRSSPPGAIAMTAVRRAARCSMCVVLIVPLLSLVEAGVGLGIVAAGGIVVAAVRPDVGLLLVAGLLPLSVSLASFSGLDNETTGEYIVLVFLTGALCRLCVRDDRLVSARRCFNLELAGVVIVAAATIVTLAAHSTSAVSALHHMATNYFIHPAEVMPLHHGLVWIEAIVLAIVTAILIDGDEILATRVLRISIVGISAAATLNNVWVIEAWIERHFSVTAALNALSGVRLGLLAPDVNAVGSLYALFAVPALCMATSNRRRWYWAALLVILPALWWTRSLAAIVGTCAGMCMTAALRTRGRAATAVVTLLMAGCAVSALPLADTQHAMSIRMETAAVGLRVAALHPVFGVGPHEMLAASRAIIPDHLMVIFPKAAHGENAHNNIVQLLAEFGFLGGSVLLLMVAVPLFRATVAARLQTPPSVVPAVVGGLGAFCVSAMAGHPLMTPLCQWLFFLLLGLASGLTSPPRDRRWERMTLWMIVVVTIAVLPWRLTAASASSNQRSVRPLESTTHGLLDKIEFTTIDRYYGFIVDKSARVVTVPLRRSADSPSGCAVQVLAGERPADVLVPPADRWQFARYSWRPPQGQVRDRLHFIVRDPACRIMVGPMNVE